MTEPTCSLITVGNELLFGETVDTNSAYIGQVLTEKGVRVMERLSVPDELPAIIRAVKSVRSDILLITGGLGPTVDDLTREALAAAFGKKLKADAHQHKRLIATFKRFKRPMAACNFNQAQVPEGFQAIDNPYGTAPALFYAKRFLFALPGVPHEMKGLMQKVVLPAIRKRFKSKPIHHVEIKTSGIGESTLQEKLKDFKWPKDITLAFLPEISGVIVRLSGSDKRLLATWEKKVRSVAGSFVFGRIGETLESVVASLLLQNKVTLAVAESCTGGRIGSKLTSLAGSSGFFLGGVIAYSNGLKKNMLAVSDRIIKEFGAVSEACACAMAKGIRQQTGADIGLSITGIAGPNGGTVDKPVGTVWIGLSDKKGERADSFFFFGNRNQIQERAAVAGLNQLRLSIS
ncbi:MAG: hypothetical protein A2293_16215 [Elusimicrobia bacterium RIFOXYB2_FULL_49_7]|nr:MAG: hypothetical protein A2293_16215 [Elusimicrobia bacterium RIFOXYB2_FULL_49_7]